MLVAGEAKRGKSTLVDALLGRVVLPVVMLRRGEYRVGVVGAVIAGLTCGLFIAKQTESFTASRPVEHIADSSAQGGVATNIITGLAVGFKSTVAPVLTIAARGEPDATLAVTGIIMNRGRLFAMGDPSAFINLMLRYPGNRKFAEGLLTYLVEPDSWGERGGKLYFVANRFQQKGQFGERSGFFAGLGQVLTDAFTDVHEHGLPDRPVRLGDVGMAGRERSGGARSVDA